MSAHIALTTSIESCQFVTCLLICPFYTTIMVWSFDERMSCVKDKFPCYISSRITVKRRAENFLSNVVNLACFIFISIFFFGGEKSKNFNFFPPRETLIREKILDINIYKNRVLPGSKKRVGKCLPENTRLLLFHKYSYVLFLVKINSSMEIISLFRPLLNQKR